jgi:uncharacterized glyoxalase superfamily protein PhnB
MTFQATAVSCSITVKDLTVSRRWYVDAVGFTVEREYERDGVPAGIVLTAGAARVLLNRDDGAKGFDRVKGEGLSIQFSVASGVDDIASRIKAVGGTLDSEPADMPWGARAFRVRDPDGFKLVFSSPLAAK